MSTNPYLDADRSSASDERCDIAASGPHAHWSAYDISLEASRFSELQELVVLERPSSEQAETMQRLASEILAMAHGFGWGSADSYLNRVSGLSSDEIDGDVHLADERDSLFNRHDETDYMEQASLSSRLVHEAAVSPEASEITEDLFSRVVAAFETGRDACVEQYGVEAANAPSP